MIPNSLTLTTLLALIWLHLLSDFFLQTDKMAINKSSSNKWLLWHIVVYCAPFSFVCGFWFALVNGIAHFATDYVTSRVTSRLWAQGKRHWFFAVIGVDQAIHLTFLVATVPLIGYWW